VGQYDCVGGDATSGLMLYFTRLCGEGTQEPVVAGIPKEAYDRRM